LREAILAFASLKGKKGNDCEYCFKNVDSLPQYKDLEELYVQEGGEARYNRIPLQNNFASQEPGSASENKGVSAQRTMESTFPMMEKISVKG
jgi:glutathione peroxidase-family protein